MASQPLALLDAFAQKENTFKTLRECDVDNEVYVDSYKPGADDFKGDGEDHHEDPLSPNPSHEPAAIRPQ